MVLLVAYLLITPKFLSLAPYPLQCLDPHAQLPLGDSEAPQIQHARIRGLLSSPPASSSCGHSVAVNSTIPLPGCLL